MAQATEPRPAPHPAAASASTGTVASLLMAAGFGVRLSDHVDVEAVRGELMRTATVSLNPDSISVWVRPPGDAP